MTAKKPKPAANDVMALRLPEELALPGPIKAVFDKCVEKLGFVPNVLRAYALRPKKFEPFRVYNNEIMLGESGLSKLEREMIAVVVSCANHCHYCLIAHGAAVRAMSENAALGDQLMTNYRTADLDRRTRAMLDFAWALTLSPATIGDDERASLRRAGFTDEDIFDIAEVTGFYNMSNRVASAVEMRPNPEYFNAGR